MNRSDAQKNEQVKCQNNTRHVEIVTIIIPNILDALPNSAL